MPWGQQGVPSLPSRDSCSALGAAAKEERPISSSPHSISPTAHSRHHNLVGMGQAARLKKKMHASFKSDHGMEEGQWQDSLLPSLPPVIYTKRSERGRVEFALYVHQVGVRVVIKKKIENPNKRVISPKSSFFCYTPKQRIFPLPPQQLQKISSQSYPFLIS